MSNQPKLKIGDTFVYTKEMDIKEKKKQKDDVKQNAPYPPIGDMLEVEDLDHNSYFLKGTLGWLHFSSVDPFLSSNKSPVKQPETWTQKTEYISKSGFKIEKDKITFPDGKTYTFDQFTKHYNQLRSVYRKLSDLKKIKVFP